MQILQTDLTILFLKAIIDRIWEGSKHFSFGDYFIKTRNLSWGCMVKIIVLDKIGVGHSQEIGTH